MSFEQENIDLNRGHRVRIGLIGKGKTGAVISKLASDGFKDHSFVIEQCFSSQNPLNGEGKQKESLKELDVFIDFSIADQVLKHVKIAANFGKPIVIGTTGWEEKKTTLQKIAKERNVGILYGANFSVGVNLFFQILKKTAQKLSKWPDYDPFLYEAHHQFKKDAPSGTAKVAQRILESSYADRKDSLKNLNIDISCTRAGFIPGRHLVGFDSEVDQITIQHEARNREGFAKGALLAAKWIQDKTGYFEFHEIIDQVCPSNLPRENFKEQ
jgi:4-hydroxy-tetrahydrodipicolinate reductase